MRLVPTQSSSLAGIAYEPGSEYVFVQFVGTRTRVYRYQFHSAQAAATAVTAVLFDEDSQGKAFVAHIKNVGIVVELVLDEMEDLNLHV